LHAGVRHVSATVPEGRISGIQIRVLTVYSGTKNRTMRNFTLFVMALIFPLAVSGQSTADIHRIITENQKEIEELAGPKVSGAAERLFSPVVQTQLLNGKPNKSGYVMKLDSLVDRIKDPEAENWEYELKNDFVYNEAWQATVIHEKEWNPAQNDWEVSGRTELTFNELGQVTMIEFHSADDEEWKAISPQARMEVIYDESDWIDYLELYEYEEGEWVLQVIQEYEFAEGERLEQIETLIYVEEEDEWSAEMTIRFSYDDADRRTSSAMYLAIEGEMDEMLYRLVEYRYDEDGRLSESEESGLDFFEGELVPEYLRKYSYFEGDQNRVLEYHWDGADWYLAHKEEVIYDHDVNFSDVAYPYRPFAMLFEWEIEADMDPDFQQLPVKYLEYDYIEDEDDFRESYQSEFFYSPTADTPEEYTITATAGEGGSISPSGDVTVTAGEDQAFSIEADEGYQIEDVLVDDESVGAVDAFTFEDVTDDHTIHATFTEDEVTYAVTFEVDIGPALDYHDQVEGFEDFNPEEHHILITGEMLGWAEPGTDEDQILEVTDNENVYSATFHLAAGTYAYKYFSDAIDDGWEGGEWDGDPNREVTVEGDMTVENIFGWPDDPVGVDPVPANIELTLYPNPADSHLRVETNTTIEEIRMLDVLGQVVYSSTVGNNNHEIMLEGLKKGIYFLQVTTAHGVSTERVQVTR